MFQATADTLLDWMETNSVEIELAECMEEYLKHRGEVDMSEIASPFPRLHSWAQEHDNIGWDNFLEGQVGRK
jgi:hypothetical protein